ncbi:EH domain containing protein [Babesia gibsoni]|uniref:EH domain containing protein n=1 Tax=Babesia gibsoni TaxID=33632 RepID=A0AAD8PEX8_BABGI|nr:EH domain containing protein [Babesia gibsoni]
MSMSTHSVDGGLMESSNSRNVKPFNSMFMDTQVITPQQDSRFRALFVKCDRRGLGRIDGDTSRRLFRTSGLPDSTLYEIWNLADSDDSGELDYRGFCQCCVLIAYCKMYPELQVAHDWLRDPQLFDHLFSTGLIAQCNPVFDTSVLEVSENGSVFKITPLDAAAYEKLFLSLDHDGDGFLEGAAIKEYYNSRQGLPDEELLLIWDLADVDKDGSLSLDEFIVMEHLIRVRQYFNLPIPTVLPPELERIVKGVNILVDDVRNNGLDTLPGPTLNGKEVLPSFPKDELHASTGHSNNNLAMDKPAIEINGAINYRNERDGDSTKIEGATTLTSPKISGSKSLLEENRHLKEHLQSLKRHVQELESDMDRMERENAYLKSVYHMKEDKMTQLYALHKASKADVANELAKLRVEEREISELQDRIKAMQRHKMRLEDEKQSLREALRQSEDASTTIMRSLRNEHNKVSAIKSDRIRVMKKKMDLVESMLNLGEQIDKPAKNVKPVNEGNKYQDSKGIRVGIGSVVYSENNSERHLTNRISSVMQTPNNDSRKGTEVV